MPGSSHIIIRKLNFDLENLNIAYYTIDHRIVRIRNAVGYVYIGRNKFDITKSCVIYIPSHEKIRSNITAFPNSKIEIDLMIIENSMFSKSVNRLGFDIPEDGNNYKSKLVFHNEDDLDSIVDAVIEINNTGICHKNIVLESLVYSLIHWIAKNSYSKHFISNLLWKRVADQIVDMVNNNLSYKWKLNDLADKMNMSTATLQRKLKDESVDFSHLLQQARLKKAKSFLISTNISISQIAEQCGFESSSYFSSVFKKANNMSPSQYRKLF